MALEERGLKTAAASYLRSLNSKNIHTVNFHVLHRIADALDTLATTVQRSSGAFDEKTIMDLRHVGLNPTGQRTAGGAPSHPYRCKFCKASAQHPLDANDHHPECPVAND
jgi:hypothetical protein